MQFDGDSLTIGLDMKREDIAAFEQFIRPRLEYVEVIEVAEGTSLHEGSLLALLASLKRSKKELRIPFLETATTTSQTYGTLYWINHD